MSEKINFPPLTVGQLIERLTDLDPALPVSIRLDTAHYDNGLARVVGGKLRHVFTVGGATRPYIIGVSLEGAAND